ncbi:MAG: Serine/Threonine/Tyrosine Kinase found in polyvalent protein, partial [Verrucomicrobiota bacterium]
SSGYTVSWGSDGAPYLHNALPHDYLQRLIWQNEVFGDDIHLVGTWQEFPHHWRIVTTQPGLQGTRATLDELASAFVTAGFTLLPWRSIGYEGSLALRCEGFDIWDVHPANVLLSPEGLPLPIDVIVTRTPH